MESEIPHQEMTSTEIMYRATWCTSWPQPLSSYIFSKMFFLNFAKWDFLALRLKNVLCFLALASKFVHKKILSLKKLIFSWQKSFFLNFGKQSCCIFFKKFFLHFGKSNFLTLTWRNFPRSRKNLTFLAQCLKTLYIRRECKG